MTLKKCKRYRESGIEHSDIRIRRHRDPHTNILRLVNKDHSFLFYCLYFLKIINFLPPEHERIKFHSFIFIAKWLHVICHLQKKMKLIDCYCLCSLIVCRRKIFNRKVSLTRMTHQWRGI